MDCEQAVALISARLDHEIEPGDRATLEAHLRDCPACRATADAFALQHEELHGAFEPRRRAAAAVAERVGARLPAARPMRRAWFVRAAVIVGGVAACAAVVLLAQWWLRPQPRMTAGSWLKPLSLNIHSSDSGELTPRPRPEPPPAAKLAVGDFIETKAGQKRRLALPDGSVLYVNENTKVRLDADRLATLTAGAAYLEVAPRDPAADGSTFTVRTPEGPVQAFGTRFEVRADDRDASVAVTQGKVAFDGIAVTAGQELRMKTADDMANTNRVELPAFVPSPRASHLLDWTRDLMAAAESPLVPASDYQGGALIAVDPYGQESKLSLRNYHIDVHVEDGFARTTIDQTYFNNNPWRLEGTFYFPLPPDASLSRLAMYVNGELMEGGMTDREWGNAVYEKVVRSQRDPALLEWVDGSTFKMRVFPLEGRQEKRIILSYTQRLPTLYGRTQYRFPAGHSLQMVDHWSFHAVVHGGAADAWGSPSHPAMRGRADGADLVLDAADDAARVDRDVEVDLADPQAGDAFGERVRFSGAEQDGARYLMLRFRPELPARTERQRRDWVILFESSADRDPLLARAQIDIIRHMLEQAEHDDTFMLLTAGTTTRRFSEEALPATPENVGAAVKFLEQTHLIGALDLGRALTDAAPLLRPGTFLVHVGSGQTAMGRRQEKLAELLPAGVCYVGVGVGKHWNRSWMKERAEDTGGYFTQINPDEPIAWRAFDLVATLNTPRLLHVQVQAAAGGPRFLTDQALVAQGEEVCAAARIDGGALPRSVVVTGVLDGQPYRRELPLADVATHADYLPRTWAKWEIDRLLAENAAENKARVVELSKAMYVMTPFTSLLVLENEAMYKEYNVDRGRKDHWAMYPCPEKIPVVFEPDPTQPIDVRNAPKTPKPVVNLVLPTVVRRSAPSLFGGEEERTPRGETAIDAIMPDPEVEGRRRGILSDDRLGRGDNGRLGDSRAAFFNSYGAARRDVTRIRFKTLPSEGVTGRLFAGDGSESEAGIRRESAPPRGQTPLDWSMPTSTEFSSAKHVLPAMRSPRRVSDPLSEGEIFEELGYGLNFSPPAARPAAAPETSAFRNVMGLGLAYQTTLMSIDLDDAGIQPANRAEASSLRRRIEQGWAPNLLYQPPSYTGDARLFSDLVSYAPGLNTTDADVRAVLDAEAAPNLADAPGHIDPDARRLIDAARRPRWRTLTLHGEKDVPDLQFHFDSAGRYAYERTLSLGLHERVVCDGDVLWHLYPELGLAARRTVSRFHRAEVADLTPWTVPPAEDLARGADVEAVDAHTVALAPLGAATLRNKDGNPAPYYRLKLMFADDGRLAERRVEAAPAGKVIRREVYDGNGGVRLFDGDGKEIAKRQSKVADSPAPDLSADTAGLVVMRMPLRSRVRVFADVGLDGARPLADELNGCYAYLEGDQAVELLAGAMTEGNADDARRVFRDCFAAHDDVRPGLFTLLAAAGADVCEEPAFQFRLFNHKDDSLARYFALLGNGGYDFLHRWTRTDLGAGVGPADSFLGRLAAFHDLETRWNAGPSPWVDAALRRADEGRTFAFIRANRGNVLGRALQVHVQNHTADDDRRLQQALAAAWGVLAGDDGAYTARYEQARCLLHAGQRDEAVRAFEDVYAKASEGGALPLIDGDFRTALQGQAPPAVVADGTVPRDSDLGRALEKGADAWTVRAWTTAADLIRKHDRSGAVMLAWQCRQVGDSPLSDNLLAFALDDVPKGRDGLEAGLAAVAYLSRTDQLGAADDILDRLIAEGPTNANDADLWRLAATLAERRQKPARAAECLETALDLEYRDLPPVIDLAAWRADYGKLLAYYQTEATALVGASAAPPTDLAARVIRAADRWRAHDPEAASACETAAAILRVLGQRDAAWEYLTTPAALRPGSVSWAATAADLGREGDVDLADRSFAAACEQDPDDALLLWQRAMSLRQAGWDAESLLRRLADGDWPEQYRWVRARAKWQLGRK